MDRWTGQMDDTTPELIVSFGALLALMLNVMREVSKISGRGFLGLSQNGISAQVLIGAQCQFII